MDRQAGSEPGDQSIKQTNPKRGRQGNQNPVYRQTGSKQGNQAIARKQTRDSLAKHTRQSGREQVKVDRYKYKDTNEEMSCR